MHGSQQQIRLLSHEDRRCLHDIVWGLESAVEGYTRGRRDLLPRSSRLPRHFAYILQASSPVMGVAFPQIKLLAAPSLMPCETSHAARTGNRSQTQVGAKGGHDHLSRLPAIKIFMVRSASFACWTFKTD